MKLVVVEAESSALVNYLRAVPSDARFTSALTRVELVRAVGRHETPDSVAHARRVLASLDLIPLTNRVLDSAALMRPLELRTLDAIHLSAALTAPELRALVTYDERLADAAAGAGIDVVAPA